MEISKELKDIALKEKSVNGILKEIRIQREEIYKKEHIFKALAVTTLIEEMIENGQFEEHGVKTIKISYHYDKNSDFNTMNFYLYGIDNKGFSKYNRSGKAEDEPLEPVKKLKEVFDRFHIFYTNEICEDFMPDEENIFDLKPGVGDNILNMLLSKELKAILQYSHLRNDLPKNKADTKGKSKV
jgi:hypothetical protein